MTSVPDLRARLVALWEELERDYSAAVRWADLPRCDWERLRVEIWWAERRLLVLAEGVAAGWFPAGVEHVDDLPEGWAA
jgi:hypothetical protein